MKLTDVGDNVNEIDLKLVYDEKIVKARMAWLSVNSGPKTMFSLDPQII